MKKRSYKRGEKGIDDSSSYFYFYGIDEIIETETYFTRNANKIVVYEEPKIRDKIIKLLNQ